MVSYITRDEAGRMHSRDGRPSLVWCDGTRAWHRYDQLHRENGPAIEWNDPDGNCAGWFHYYLFGRLVSECTHRRIVTLAARWRYRRLRPHWLCELDAHLVPDVARLVVDTYLKPSYFHTRSQQP